MPIKIQLFVLNLRTDPLQRVVFIPAKNTDPVGLTGRPFALPHQSHPAGEMLCDKTTW